MFPHFFIKYMRLQIWRKLACTTRKYDPFYFLQHKFHLSKRFTVKQRVASALTHHEYESKQYTELYDRRVYREDGICLWTHEVDGHCFRIVLTGSEDNQNEGELSVVLSGDGKNLWRISFSYICGSTFLWKPRVFFFLTRNQSENNDKSIFYKCFSQNHPKLFVLSAVCGIVQANGNDSFLAIRHDRQIAYDEALDSGFYNSYTHMWKQFSGHELDGQVYEVATPLKILPLDSVSRPHRARARVRREFWHSISRHSNEALMNYRKH